MPSNRGAFAIFADQRLLQQVGPDSGKTSGKRTNGKKEIRDALSGLHPSRLEVVFPAKGDDPSFTLEAVKIEGFERQRRYFLEKTRLLGLGNNGCSVAEAFRQFRYGLVKQVSLVRWVHDKVSTYAALELAALENSRCTLIISVHRSSSGITVIAIATSLISRSIVTMSSFLSIEEGKPLKRSVVPGRGGIAEPHALRRQCAKTNVPRFALRFAYDDRLHKRVRPPAPAHPCGKCQQNDGAYTLRASASLRMVR